MFALIVTALVLAPAIVLFLDGFSNADQGKDEQSNETLKAVVLLITRIYYLFWKMGRWARYNIARGGRS
jgi:hypothetical protein